MGSTSNNPSADGSVTPTPATPVMGTPTSDGLLPQKSPLTLEEALKRIATLEHEHGNAKEAEDRLGKKLAAYEKAQKQQEAAAAEATQRQLEEQGKFKEIAEQHEARVRQLEPIEQRYNTLAGQVRAQIQAETKDWPAEVKAFYPGDDAPLEQVNDWYQRSKPLMEKLQQQARTQSPGNAPGPKPAGEMTPEQMQRSVEERLRRSGRYGSR